MMMREVAVQVAEQFRDLTAQGAKNWRGDRPSRGIARIHYDGDPSWQAAKLSADELLIRRDNRCRLFSSLTGHKDAVFDELAQLLNFLAVDGDLAQADLKAVVLRGIVTTSDL